VAQRDEIEEASGNALQFIQQTQLKEQHFFTTGPLAAVIENDAIYKAYLKACSDYFDQEAKDFNKWWYALRDKPPRSEYDRLWNTLQDVHKTFRSKVWAARKCKWV
jgi:O6-methylguanine-DNA--protein-cysteine methyltransferase